MDKRNQKLVACADVAELLRGLGVQALVGLRLVAAVRGKHLLCCKELLPP